MCKNRWYLVVTLGMILALSLPGFAQSRRRQRIKHDTPERTKSNEPLTEVQLPVINWLSGEARVRVEGDQHPVIKIGMAPSGITIIEFPASDVFFAVHPPENGDWIQVEKSPSLKTDHHLTLRAGKDLANASGPAASVSVQMRSGLLITLWVYPVKQIAQQTHRCVVSYDRAEIVNARRKAGLATNLGEQGEAEIPKPSSLAVNISPISTPEILKAVPLIKLPSPAPSKPQTVAEIEKADRQKIVGDSDLKSATKKLLDQAVADPKRFRKWTHDLHGLSVSAHAFDLDGQSRIAVVAVRNVSAEVVRILPDNPQLIVETLDEKGKTLLISPLKVLYLQSTMKSSLVPVGSIVYYAMAFDSPLLGARQHLRVAVGQTNAADEPVSTGLSTGKK